MKTKTITARRLKDDEYWDHVSVQARGAQLHIYVVPRLKQSGLSGDEWRISTSLVLTNHYGDVFKTTFHTMNGAMNYGSHFIWMEGRKLLDAMDATLVVMRKGHTLWTQRFNTFGDAAIGLAWHVVHANESEPCWAHLTNEQERQHCLQPSCKEPPVCLYKLKQFREGDGHVMVTPDDDDWRYAWFCARHAGRGDCGLEDCDSNYEVIEAVPR